LTEEVDTLNLKGSKSSTGGKGKGKGGPIAEFIFGVILIWLALPAIWMNERRDVRFFKLAIKGQRAVRPADCN
jgi:hypothetical protein